MSEKQEELAAKHGTPKEFAAAVWRALGEISIDEALAAIAKYEQEWADAA